MCVSVGFVYVIHPALVTSLNVFFFFLWLTGHFKTLQRALPKVTSFTKDNLQNVQSRWVSKQALLKWCRKSNEAMYFPIFLQISCDSKQHRHAIIGSHYTHWHAFCIELQFFSVALVHFSDQNWNSQNYLFNLHKKSSFSFLWTSCKCFGTSMQMIIYNSLLFPTLSIAYAMLIKMYYNGSLLNCLIPTTFRH